MNSFPLTRTDDTRGRPLGDLRISLTDRCNFRCTYCMPRETFGVDHQYIENSALLTIPEIVRVATVFHRLGVRKIRLTGGEPLLRAGIEDLIEQLSRLPDLDIALTTNGSLLARKAARLAAAGLNRVTVSMDSLDEALFKTVTDSRTTPSKVLSAIDTAAAAGLGPVKINMVVKAGTTDRQILPMAEHFRHTGHVLRFIEFMDVGESNGWAGSDVISAADIVARINAVHPLEPLEASYLGEVATRFRYRDGAGEIGVIGSMSAPFCQSCTRARLSAHGRLHTCLFASKGTDIRAALRDGSTDANIEALVGGRWATRTDNYSQDRSTGAVVTDKIEMSYIGG